jgi:(2Fe-2S) ferredoxin
MDEDPPTRVVLVGMSVREVSARERLLAVAREHDAAVAFLQVGDPSLSRELTRLADAGCPRIVLVGVSLGTLAPANSWLRRIAAHWWRERGASAPVIEVATSLVTDLDGLDGLDRSRPETGLETWLETRPVTGAEPGLTSAAWEDVPGHRHQVLVCRGPRCSAVGSDATAEAFVLALMRHGLGDDDVLLTHTACQFPCNQAPVVSVQPDDVWYGGVDRAGADLIVEGHLVALGLELVAGTLAAALAVAVAVATAALAVGLLLLLGAGLLVAAGLLAAAALLLAALVGLDLALGLGLLVALASALALAGLALARLGLLRLAALATVTATAPAAAAAALARLGCGLLAALALGLAGRAGLARRGGELLAHRGTSGLARLVGRRLGGLCRDELDARESGVRVLGCGGRARRAARLAAAASRLGLHFGGRGSLGLRRAIGRHGRLGCGRLGRDRRLGDGLVEHGRLGGGYVEHGRFDDGRLGDDGLGRRSGVDDLVELDGAGAVGVGGDQLHEFSFPTLRGAGDAERGGELLELGDLHGGQAGAVRHALGVVGSVGHWDLSFPLARNLGWPRRAGRWHTKCCARGADLRVGESMKCRELHDAAGARTLRLPGARPV